jgi:hypothetical protein
LEERNVPGRASSNILVMTGSNVSMREMAGAARLASDAPDGDRVADRFADGPQKSCYRELGIGSRQKIRQASMLGRMTMRRSA